MYFDLLPIALKSCVSYQLFFFFYLAAGGVRSRFLDSERQYFCCQFRHQVIEAEKFSNFKAPLQTLQPLKIWKRAKNELLQKCNIWAKSQTQQFEMYERPLKLRASCLCRPSTLFYVCDRTSRRALKSSLSKCDGKVSLRFINQLQGFSKAVSLKKNGADSLWADRLRKASCVRQSYFL